MRTITDAELGTLLPYMKGDIREYCHRQMAPCTPNEFIDEYLDRDPDFIEIVNDVIGGI